MGFFQTCRERDQRSSLRVADHCSVELFKVEKKSKTRVAASMLKHSSEAMWESRWPSWAVRPNEPSGFHGHKAILNHALALVSACPCQLTSEDIKQHYLPSILKQNPNTWKVKKNTYSVWHHTTCEFLGKAPLSSDRTTLKQQLNSKKWNVGYLSACGCGVSVSCVWKIHMLCVVILNKHPFQPFTCKNHFNKKIKIKVDYFVNLFLLIFNAKLHQEKYWQRSQEVGEDGVYS